MERERERESETPLCLVLVGSVMHTGLMETARVVQSRHVVGQRQLCLAQVFDAPCSLHAPVCGIQECCEHAELGGVVAPKPRA